MFDNSDNVAELISLYKLLWDECVIGLAQIDKNNYFTKANEAFCSMVGYSENELKSKTWMQITHPEDVDDDLNMSKLVQVKDKTHYEISKRYITKMGAVIWVVLNAIGYYDPKGEFKLFLVQVRPAELVTPAIIVSEDNKAKLSLLKESSKWIVSTIAGLILTVLGTVKADTLIQNAGLCLLGITAGGYALKK